MKYIKITLFTLTLFFAASAAIDTSQSTFYMYTYFVQGEDEQSFGARLALSNDGITWDKYNNETPIIVPEPNMVGKAGGKPLMRDPNVYLDPNTGVFHLTWTTQWEDDVIGYAYSKDLKKWSTQIKIPVGRRIKNCACCWAPEFFYDDTRDSVMVMWSTNRGIVGKEAFCSYTKDFKTYSYPEVYFEPKTKAGTKYSIIDETLIKVGPKRYYLFYKDERTNTSLFATQVIHCTFAESPKGAQWWTGPNEYEGGSNDITSIGFEGPTAYIVGDELRLVSDPFKVHENTDRIKTAKIDDLMGSAPPATWSKGPVMKTSTGQNFLPSHGSIAEIPKPKVLQLLYNIPDQTVYPQPWTDITADDIVVKNKDGGDEDIYPLGQRNCGCGTGVGFAFLPPIIFKGWALRRRKKQNTKTK